MVPEFIQQAMRDHGEFVRQAIKDHVIILLKRATDTGTLVSRNDIKQSVAREGLSLDSTTETFTFVDDLLELWLRPYVEAVVTPEGLGYRWRH